MRKRNQDISSFDMLLDTMCNTFGGVCFIALLIAIISANLPKNPASETPVEVKTIEQNESMNALLRKKEELLTALNLQEVIKNKKNPDQSVLQKDVSEIRSSSEKASLRLSRISKEYEQLMAEISALGADLKVNEDAYDRLQKIAEELKKKEQDIKGKQTQVARAPMKHSTSKSPLHLVFKKGRAGIFNFPGTRYNTVDFEVVEGLESLLATPRDNFGIAVGNAFESSDLGKRILLTAKGDWFVNLLTDDLSFTEVCVVRDILIRNGVSYNWNCYQGGVISFVSASSFETQ